MTTTSPLRPQPTRTTSAPAVVELRGVRRHYGTGSHRVQAVDKVDLTIHQGEIVALLGPNGAGKTTTLDMLLGLTDPSDGIVQVLGGTPQRAAKAGSIAAVLQTGGLLSDLTVRETVELIASLYGRDALARVPEVMARADLTHLARRRVAKCSGGEQQRVKFALALAADPDILILDEPTAGMGVDEADQLIRMIVKLAKDPEQPMALFLVEHRLELVLDVSQRVIVMDGGKLLADGPSAEIAVSQVVRDIYVGGE